MVLVAIADMAWVERVERDWKEAACSPCLCRNRHKQNHLEHHGVYTQGLVQEFDNSGGCFTPPDVSLIGKFLCKANKHTLRFGILPRQINQWFLTSYESLKSRKGKLKSGVILWELHAPCVFHATCDKGGSSITAAACWKCSFRTWDSPGGWDCPFFLWIGG